jgi:hypothetical protein
MNGSVDTPHPRPGPAPGGSGRRAGQLSLVQAAARRRIAERAFEDYVREMARRWDAPSGADGEDGSPPPSPRLS